VKAYIKKGSQALENNSFLALFSFFFSSLIFFLKREEKRERRRKEEEKLYRTRIKVVFLQSILFPEKGIRLLRENHTMFGTLLTAQNTVSI